MSRQPTGTRSIRRSRPSPALLFLLALLAWPAPGDIGSRDPEFLRFPFQQWLTENHPAQIRWNVVVQPADLSTHQRLILRVRIQVDGKEIEKRQPNGEFEGLIEYRDSEGHVWQNHASADPASLQATTQRQVLELVFYAFVLPGDYTVSIAICDPKTGQHSVTVRKAHVAPLKNDPMPALWAGLPPVDIIGGRPEPPDVWYLPDIDTSLNLPVRSKRPLHLQLLVNTTPSGRSAGSAVTMRDNMSLLIPALKMLSQLRLKDGTIDAALLDLTNRTVPFEQKNIKTLDWQRMRKYFLETKPGIIDVHTLADRNKMLAFFAAEVSKRLAPRGDGAVQVVIVLSGPAFFEEQDPAMAPMEPSEPDRQLIYIRYRPVAFLRGYPQGNRPQGRFGRSPISQLPPQNPDALIPPLPEDDLEKTAEPMNARLFDAASTHQFRRILAAILEQLAAQ
jgi:hypothetical protein